MTESEWFVKPGSVVREIWGKSDTILFIFAGASAEFALNKARMKDSIYGSNADMSKDFGNQALQIAKFRQDAIEGNRQGQLTERNTSRAGNLAYEDLNQRGSNTLIDAIMKQYGSRRSA